MPLHPTTIDVLPNPWHSLDSEGRPAGACHLDPDLFGVLEVGARIKSASVEKLSAVERQKRISMLRTPRQKIEWEFETTKPTTLRFTGDCQAVVMRKLRNRELLPATREAARLAGIKNYCEPAEALARAKQAARVRFDAENYAGAFGKMAAERGESVPQPTTVEAARPGRSKSAAGDTAATKGE